MSFKSNLNEFLFNLETLDFLSNNTSSDEIVSTLSEVGFSDELTRFLLVSRRSYVNSVLLRLRLYNKQDKTLNQVMNLMSKYETELALVQTLFSEESSELVSNDVVDVVDVVDVASVASAVSAVSVASAVSAVSVASVASVASQVSVVSEVSVNTETMEENLFDKFFNECAKVTENEDDKVKNSQFYKTFVEWCKEDKVPTKKELKNYLVDKLGKSVKSSWSGVSLN